MPYAPATLGGPDVPVVLTERLVDVTEDIDVRTATMRHSRTVAAYAEMIARELRFSEPAVEEIGLAGLLHDIGKIGISERILCKPDRLKHAEWIEMRNHARLGASIVEDAGLEEISGWVLCHHERPDGRGYPLGLQGDAIPLEARILAVADAYEAMTNDRVYRDAIGHTRARAELRCNAGTQFDEDVVAAFLCALADRPFAIHEITDDSLHVPPARGSLRWS